MNSVERFHTAMRRGTPDRVPICEGNISPKVMRALIPDYRDMGDFKDRIGLDAVTAMPGWAMSATREDGTSTDDWGVIYKADLLEDLPHPFIGPIHTVADIDRWTPPDPEAPHRLGTLPALVERYKGRRAIVFHHREAFMWSVYLCGMENLMLMLMDDPGALCALLDKVLESNIATARRAIRAGAEVVTLADDYAGNKGPLISPRLLEKYVIPRLARMVEAIHEEGALCMKHTDGNIYPILEMMVETGIDAINPLERAAGMDLKTVKRLVGDRVALVGNIDCSALLCSGTPAEVRVAVKQAIADAGPAGYVVSSSNSIHSAVKPDNYLAMVQAVTEPAP